MMSSTTTSMRSRARTSSPSAPSEAPSTPIPSASRPARMTSTIAVSSSITSTWIGSSATARSLISAEWKGLPTNCTAERAVHPLYRLYPNGLTSEWPKHSRAARIRARTRALYDLTVEPQLWEFWPGLPSRSQWSMARAAVLPAPIARITVAEPVTMSPPEKTPGTLVAPSSSVMT